MRRAARRPQIEKYKKLLYNINVIKKELLKGRIYNEIRIDGIIYGCL